MGIVGRWADSIPKRRIQWLWHPFIQRGAINLITGGPGTGKSTIACEIASALSRGRTLPGETPEQARQRGILKTWMFNAEDDPEDTIVWRLDNQGADRSKILITSIGQTISFKIIDEIRDAIRANGIDLLVIDPVQAWIPADTDMHRANQMREWGNLFRALCHDLGVTVIWVRHRRKGDADDAHTINSGLGSIDMSGIVRSEIGAIATKKGSKIVRIKGSVGATNIELSYSIRGVEEEGNDHGQLHWSGGVQAAQVRVKEATSSPTKGNPVDSWLIGHLTTGPKPAQDMVDAARRLGYSESTLQRRAGDLVIKFKEDGRYFWRLRTPQDNDANGTDDGGNG